MEDYLSENEQWDAVKRWLKENGTWIIGGVVLGAGLLLGWRWWEAHVTSRSEVAATQFADLQSALAENKDTRARELAAKLQQEYSNTPYADQAQLALARTEVESGALDKAAERLRTVADTTEDAYLREVARVRLARVQIAQNKPDDALATLEKVKGSGFAAVVSEVRGDALLTKGDKAGALEAYRAALLEAGSEADGGLLQLKINDLTEPKAARVPNRGTSK